jgi:hypothetical protein
LSFELFSLFDELELLISLKLDILLDEDSLETSGLKEFSSPKKSIISFKLESLK